MNQSNPGITPQAEASWDCICGAKIGEPCIFTTGSKHGPVGKERKWLIDDAKEIVELLDNATGMFEFPILDKLRVLIAEIKRLRKTGIAIHMILYCPMCHARHLDKDDMPHHRTHACQSCGFLWAPAIVPTHGVQFLPGCKNGT